MNQNDIFFKKKIIFEISTSKRFKNIRKYYFLAKKKKKEF